MDESLNGDHLVRILETKPDGYLAEIATGPNKGLTILLPFRFAFNILYEVTVRNGQVSVD